ncbi:MAG: hypothetical protein LBL33_07410 [Tannerella sp.]|jgi:hypothetical protein|nr:hypothetical protein [Tannerella sp.]
MSFRCEEWKVLTVISQVPAYPKATYSGYFHRYFGYLSTGINAVQANIKQHLEHYSRVVRGHSAAYAGINNLTDIKIINCLID